MEIDISTSYMTADSLLYAVSHRPWLPPDRPWAVSQTFQHVLFASYAIAPEVLLPLLPERFNLDLYRGSAWVTVVCQEITGLRGNGTPALPFLSKFLAVGVRTFVTCNGKPGYLHLSYDAANLSAVWTARVFLRLPFWHSVAHLAPVAISREESPDAPPFAVAFQNQRLHGPQGPSGAPEISVRYGATGAPFTPRPGTLEQFLLDRYCSYTQSKGRLYRVENHHLPYNVQSAAAQFTANTMTEPLGFSLPAAPQSVLCAHSLRLLLWSAEKL